MGKYKFFSYAKINPFLEVYKKRTNGYHDIVTVMQTISLCDSIELITNTGKTEVIVEDFPKLCGESNIVYRTIESFFAFCKIGSHAKAVIKKNIPVAAGLGGGSSNAASVLVMLNRAYGNIAKEKDLMSLAAKLGADVPFFINGGCRLACGIGEKLTPLVTLPKCYLVISIGGTKASTEAMYNMLDEINERKIVSEKDFILSLADGDIRRIGQNTYNAFEAVCKTDMQIKEEFEKYGCVGSFLSGSGPSYVGIFEDKTDAAMVCEKLNSFGIKSYLSYPI